MARKSVIYGEYIITCEDGKEIRVTQIFDKAKPVLEKICKTHNLDYPESANTQQLGRIIVKSLGDGEQAEVDGYTVLRRPSKEDSSSRPIDVSRDFLKGTVKAELRKIADKAGMKYDEAWNTQTLGSKLIDFIETGVQPEIKEKKENPVEEVKKEEENGRKVLPKAKFPYAIYFVLMGDPVYGDDEEYDFEEGDFFDEGGFYVYRIEKEGKNIYGVSRDLPKFTASEHHCNLNEMEMFPLEASYYQDAKKYPSKFGIYLNEALYNLYTAPDSNILDLCPSQAQEPIMAAIDACDYEPNWELEAPASCFIIDEDGNVLREWTAASKSQKEEFGL